MQLHPSSSDFSQFQERGASLEARAKEKKCSYPVQGSVELGGLGKVLLAVLHLRLERGHRRVVRIACCCRRECRRFWSMHQCLSLDAHTRVTIPWRDVQEHNAGGTLRPPQL